MGTWSLKPKPLNPGYYPETRLKTPFRLIMKQYTLNLLGVPIMFYSIFSILRGLGVSGTLTETLKGTLK